MKVKVCGNTLPEQVNALEELGVQLAGFIFYPKSARCMRNKISPEKMKQIKGRIARVGVFVNEEYDDLMRTVEAYRLDMVQLHGDENPRYCERIADYISVIKAFRLADNDSIEHMTRPFDEVCDFFMFDTLGSGYGGTGKKFDWGILDKTPPAKPYFLSGGIEPGDADRLREFSKSPAGNKLFAIDINSKFEVNAGVKDMNKVKTFLAELEHHNYPI